MAGRVAGTHGPRHLRRGVVDAHGWNISKRTRCALTREHGRTRVPVVVLGWRRGGTLLGCRSTRQCWLVSRSITRLGWLSWWGGVGGLLFVNYIVDASIFDAAHLEGCVVCSLMIYLCCVAYKLLRAHGGCLGIRS